VNLQRCSQGNILGQQNLVLYSMAGLKPQSKGIGINDVKRGVAMGEQLSPSAVQGNLDIWTLCHIRRLYPSQ